VTTSSNLKVLLLGSSGLLGSSLLPYLVSQGYAISTNSRVKGCNYQADLSMQNEANELLEKVKPLVIVNLIGLTDVDYCETHPNQAYITNVRILENIVGWIRQAKTPCHLVHVSTDQVYDGIGPHSEMDVTLTNYYAYSKYAGELAAHMLPSTILRTNFFGRSRCATRTSLTDWLFRSLSDNVSIQVFEDVVFSPLSMSTLVKMIELSILMKPVGVFNVGSQDGLSKADFSFAFAEELNLSISTMKRIRSDQVRILKTYRPKDMRMNSVNFENTLSVKLPKLADEIKLVAKEYHELL
jgi:dTDP-4-dehydrorhamnose reductase